MTIRAALGCFILVAGCSGALPDESVQVRAVPRQAEVQPSAANDSCELELRVSTMPADAGRTVLNATLLNRTQAPIEVTLPDRCPAGPIDFDGLGEGFDYYEACAAGACPGPRTPRVVQIAAGQTVQVATASLEFASSACQRLPSPGHYTITPLPLQSASRVCTYGVGIDVQAEPPPAPPPPAPPVVPAPSAPQAFHSSNPYACQSPSDCVISCPSAPGCCGWPCGCSHAINREHAAAFEANYPRTCQHQPNCPAMGCAYSPAMSATCRAGRCVAGDGPGL
ncbi:MAG: hypothetical protein IPK60_17640 [Sandaracinaceae bacterium]|nr:hypothetical protein [Sandaracinaceae bacterium]